MRKRIFKTLLAGLMLVGGLIALPASPVEAAECDITVTIQADIPLSLDVSDPTNPVFIGSGEVLPKSQFDDTKQVVSVSIPDELTLQTPSGKKTAPEGSKAEIIGSINARKGFHNYCLEHSYPEILEKDKLSVVIPVTPELISYGIGEYSVSIPITFTASVEYGLYNYHYDFTSWPDLITNGDITVSSAKLTNAKTTGMVLDMDPSITSIGSNAFKNSHCHEVIIPSSVTSGANAFNGSPTEIVTFAPGTVTVPASICTGAKNLQIASLATSVKNIGAHAFEDCTAMYLVSNLMYKELGANCFKNCTSLEEFTVYNGTTCSVSMQSSSPFYGSGLKRVNVSAGTTKISSYMFVNCPNLSEVDLPPTLSTLGSYAFASVPKLKEITIRSNISRDNTSTTAGCFSNTGLTKITFEDGVSSVPRYMFSGGCANVTELNLPDSITYIDSSAFSGCSSLTGLDLPDGLTTLGGDAFENATSLKEIHIEKDIALPRSCIVSPFAGSGLEKIVIDEGVTTVVPNLFNRGCDHVTEISLPSTIQVLGGQAFGNAASLKSVTIPVNVSLPYGGVVSPFDNSALETIIFSEGVTAIPSSLFRSGCSKVTSIVFPSTLQSIGYDAFDGCTSLTELNLPESVTSIGLGAFEDSVSLTSLNVNSSWSKPSGADMSPFAGSGLTSVTVKPGLTQIKAMHLANNSNVAIVMEIPTSVTSIDGSAFLEGEIYSVIYDGTSAQYELITKGEGFTPTCVICTDTILTNSLMEEVNEDDLDDLFSGLLDEPEEEDAEPIAEEDTEEDLTEHEEPVIIPVDVTDPDETDEIDSSAGEENYAEPIPAESPDNGGIMQAEGVEGADTAIGNPDSGTAIPETTLDTGDPVTEEVNGDVG